MLHIEKPVKNEPNDKMTDQTDSGTQMKASKGSQTLQTSAFLDPGSTATFFAQRILRDNSMLQDGRLKISYKQWVENKPSIKRTIRVVFDCTSSYKGTSLINELLQGPDLSHFVLICYRERLYCQLPGFHPND